MVSRAMTQKRGVLCSGLSCFVSRLVEAWCLAPDLSCQTHQWRSVSMSRHAELKPGVPFIVLFDSFIACYVM